MKRPGDTVSWLENPFVLIQDPTLVLKEGDVTANWNAAVRGFLLVIVVGLVGSYGFGPSWPVLLLALYIVYYGSFLYSQLTAQPVKETFRSPEPVLDSSFPTGFADELPVPNAKPTETKPTAQNPFMNVLLDELKYNPDRPAAAPVSDPLVKSSFDDYFQVQWTSDPTDVFNRSQSQRQFYTMPNTTVPNDRANYQNWLYGIPGKTCKEGGRDKCFPGTNGGVVPWLSNPN